MTSRKFFAAPDLPNPAVYQPDAVLLPQPSGAGAPYMRTPFSAVLALRSETQLLQGLHFTFSRGFETAQAPCVVMVCVGYHLATDARATAAKEAEGVSTGN
eukprot:1160569-Pelagomonas_calceolata.AAC.6